MPTAIVPHARKASDMTELQNIVFALACLLIGLSKGGFGGALPVVLVVPLLSLVMNPNAAVPLTTPFLIVADFFALRIYWGKWDKRLLRLMLPAAVVGVLMGGLLLSSISPSLLKLLIALFTVLVIVYKFASDRLQSISYTHRNWHGYLTGWSTGLGAALANTGGPTFTTYLLLQSVPAVTFIGTATLFFALVNWMKIPIYLQQGLLDIERLLSVAWALPIVPFGVWLGRRSLDYINQATFERILIVFLFISVVLLLGTL